MTEIVRILILGGSAIHVKSIVCELSKAQLKFVFKVIKTKKTVVKHLKEFAPDLILADSSVPRFDGSAALLSVKELAPSTPLIILTPSIDAETAIKYLKAGVSDCINFRHIDRLGPAARQALEEKQAREKRERAQARRGGLRECEEKQRTILRHIGEIVYLVQASAGDFFRGSVQWVGGQVCNISGYRPEEFMQDPGLWFSLIHVDDVPRLMECTQNIGFPMPFTT